MMSEIVLFCSLALVPILLPGPSIVVATTNSVVLGARPAIRLAGLDLVGTIVTSTAVLIGLGPVLNRTPGAITAVKVIGISYLVVVTVQAVRNWRARRVLRRTGTQTVDHGSEPGRTAGDRPAIGAVYLVKSFAAGFFNPKTIVFFSLVSVGDANGVHPATLVACYTAEKGAALALLILVVARIAATVRTARGAVGVVGPAPEARDEKYTRVRRVTG